MEQAGGYNNFNTEPLHSEQPSEPVRFYGLPCEQIQVYVQFAQGFTGAVLCLSRGKSDVYTGKCVAAKNTKKSVLCTSPVSFKKYFCEVECYFEVSLFKNTFFLIFLTRYNSKKF